MELAPCEKLCYKAEALLSEYHVGHQNLQDTYLTRIG